MLNFFQRLTSRFLSALQCFLRDPKRAATAAGIMFGALIVILYIVQVVAMFVPTTPVAATVLPLLSQQNLAMIALVAIIVITSLGFDKVSFTLPNGSSVNLEDAREKAVESLERIADDVEPEEP